MSNSDLRVVIVAEDASFRFGGEASLPLHYFLRLRQRGIEAWLIVHGRTRSELDALFPNDQGRILSIPDNWVHRMLWKPSTFLPRRVYGATFGIATQWWNQLLQRRIVRTLVKSAGVNLVHQPTPVSPKTPSFLCKLGVPVVIGPMNGGMDYPAAFRGDESLVTRASIAIGRSSANLMNRLIAGKRDAAILLVANERTRKALPAGMHGKVIELPENGVDLEIWQAPGPRWSPDSRSSASPSSSPVEDFDGRFIFVGRLVDWKRLDLLLYALLEVPQATLEVVGDGAMKQEWSALARQLGVEDRVSFVGWLPQPECAEHLRTATALLLPSIYECGGAVVLEAMAAGTPVIATDWGGPSDYITAACGFLVDPASRDSIIRGFVAAMRTLGSNKELHDSMGRLGRKHVELNYDWEKKLDAMLDVYREATRIYRQANDQEPTARKAVTAMRSNDDFEKKADRRAS